MACRQPLQGGLSLSALSHGPPPVSCRAPARVHVLDLQDDPPSHASSETDTWFAPAGAYDASPYWAVYSGMSTAGPLVSAMARNPPPGLFFACLQLTVEWEHRAYKCYYAQLHTRYCACCTREDGHEGELGPEHYQVGRGIR